MLIRVCVILGCDRITSFQIEHFDSADGVEVVHPDVTALLDINNTPLTILCINTGLNVRLEPIVETGAQDMHIGRTVNHEAVRSCAMTITSWTILEVWVSRELPHLRSKRCGCLGIREKVRALLHVADYVSPCS